ncbi:hypothetical protein HL658_05200 [Azospirillum sp. RWY-5-1]|uniref:PARP catalytic domain-containing protein n=1 Tax=Azospirillum oleiclasticum TaxID=2735135 RepID=A0ABX2T7G3_9PROT|nr:hypothetical protein [Azospirillum oleiclasticum]NYZ11938.1 hypothetical protein [Azospirillum oleiclasticum]NYZ19098.1 hypothetical protein [Azospirillum oleiclasticum]
MLIHPPSYWPNKGWMKGWNGASADDQDDNAVSDAIDTDNVTAGYTSAKLDPGSEAFKAIAAYIRRNITESPYTSERGEKTRMAWARDQANDSSLSAFQRQTAARRARETSDKSVAPPSSRPVTVRKVRVIRNLPLWEMYENYRNELTSRFTINGTSNPLAGIVWSSAVQSDSATGLRGLPVMNEPIGEVMLFHGTSKNFIKMIVSGGFRPDLGRNKGTVANPQFGMLGQGTYFTDSFSKMMTYAGCKICGDFECNCRSAKTRRKIARNCILARVVLGIPEHYGSKLQAMLKIGQHKANHAGYKKTGFDETRGGQHSVFSQGFKTGTQFNPFSFGSGANEMLARRTQQMYPEFVVSYVLGDDDVGLLLIEAVRKGIQTYERRTHWNQSKETKNALTKIKDSFGKGDDRLMAVVCYFLSCQPTSKVNGLIADGMTDKELGTRLKPDSQFRKDLFEAVRGAGYVY